MTIFVTYSKVHWQRQITRKTYWYVGMGYGGGGAVGDGGKNSGSGGGAGAGVGISPIGFLATKGDEIKMISASGKGFSAMLEKIPDVIEKAIQSETDLTAEPEQ